MEEVGEYNETEMPVETEELSLTSTKGILPRIWTPKLALFLKDPFSGSP